MSYGWAYGNDQLVPFRARTVLVDAADAVILVCACGCLRPDGLHGSLQGCCVTGRLASYESSTRFWRHFAKLARCDASQMLRMKLDASQLKGFALDGCTTDTAAQTYAVRAARVLVLQMMVRARGKTWADAGGDVSVADMPRATCR